MKTTDSLVPYILMSMHPLLHGSMLLSSSILLSTNYDQFYEIKGTCDAPVESEAQSFILGNKRTLMNYAVVGHAVCLICHWLHQLLSHYEIKVVANLFMISKMMISFFVNFKIQSSIDFDDCTDITDNSMVMAWLTYEVIAFYLNLISLGVFIFIQNFKTFKSIRDRLGLSGDQRKRIDFLQYSKDDIHWWSAWFVQLNLCILSLTFREGSFSAIKYSVIEVFVKHLFGAYLIRQLYFNSKFQFKLSTKVVLLLTVLVNMGLIFRYVELKNSGSKWWGPIVLNDIVIYFLIFAQMIQEWMSWGEKLTKWRMDLSFDQQYRTKSSDVSETQIRQSMVQIYQSINDEGLDGAEDMEKIAEKLPAEDYESVKVKKDMAVGASIYSAVFFTFMKANKKQYKMTNSMQYDLFWKALFCFAFQMFFFYCVLTYGNIQFVLNNETYMQLSLIFTTLLLHVGVVAGARSGMYMMKYSLCHPEEFSHPEIAFLMGFLQFFSMWFAELINIMKSSQRKTAQELITSYVGFKVLLEVPNIYVKSLNTLNVPVLGAIKKLSARQGRKTLKYEGDIKFQPFFNFVYVLNKWFYNAFYFYFFTFVVIGLPFVRVLYQKEQ